MFRRTRARETALQLLFQQDQNKTPMPRKALTAFVRQRALRDPETVDFCLALYDGVLLHKAGIDELLAAASQNWRLARMLPADRNVLRIGVFELVHAAKPEPVPVVLNEAIELARRYGSKDSPPFVNGILDRVARDRAAAAKSAAATTPKVEA